MAFLCSFSYLYLDLFCQCIVVDNHCKVSCKLHFERKIKTTKIKKKDKTTTKKTKRNLQDKKMRIARGQYGKILPR